MNRDEVIETITSDINLMVRFCTTENLDKGEDVYIVCDFCKYHTKHVIYDNIDTIDDEIARHLYDRHRSAVLKKIYEYQSEKIASAPGQKTLDMLEAVDSKSAITKTKIEED
jgi:hypothetical protein